MRLVRHFGRVHKDILKNLDLEASTGPQRLGHTARKAWDSLTDPENGENISELGDLTSYYALCRAQEKMELSFITIEIIPQEGGSSKSNQG